MDRRPSAGSTDIADYNDFVQCHAEREYNDPVVRDHAQRFRALVSTASVDARDNTATTGIGVPIHWNGGNSDRPDISHGEAGPKVADDYADFYDGDWDEECRWHYPFGNGRALRETQRIDTGSQADGTGHAGHELGAATVAAGTLRAPTEGVCEANDGTVGPLGGGTLLAPSPDRGYYGLSPIFEVAQPTAPRAACWRRRGAWASGCWSPFRPRSTAR